MKVLFLFVCLCLSASAVKADDPDTTKVRQVELNEVVVRSFKQNRDLRLEPLSASSVTGTAIQNKNITGIKEFSSFIPNLFMPDYGSKLTSPVYIRGIGSKINAPSVGLYVDGIPYFEKSAFDFDLDEVRVLDAFGGSGALGLEMLSRGVRSLTTFEIDRNAARLITKNFELLCRDRARWRVVTGDVLASASRGRVPGGPFDLVLLDPPYAFGAEPVEELLQNLAQQGLLAPGAYALFEHAAADAGAHPADFETVREKRYGITSVDLLRWVGDDDGEGDSAGTDADNNDATTFQEDAHE